MSWTLHDQEGRWTAGDWEARVTLQSNSGVRFYHRGEYLWGLLIHPTDPSIYPTGSDCPASDFYVRGGDLVAAYAERAPLPFAYQVYYCALPSDPRRLSLELWLSVQTSTLEAHPTLLLHLEEEGESKRSAAIAESPGVVALRGRTAGVIVHPLDQKDVSLDVSSPTTAVLKAFGGFMEKGVIRRMRLQLVTSEAVIAPKEWDEIVSAFAASPLPLTA